MKPLKSRTQWGWLGKWDRRCEEDGEALKAATKDTSPRSNRSEEAAGCPEPRGPAGRQEIQALQANQNGRASPPPRPHVVVLEEAEHPELSEDPLTGDQVLEDVGHLL